MGNSTLSSHERSRPVGGAGSVLSLKELNNYLDSQFARRKELMAKEKKIVSEGP